MLVAGLRALARTLAVTEKLVDKGASGGETGLRLAGGTGRPKPARSAPVTGPVLAAGAGGGLGTTGLGIRTAPIHVGASPARCGAGALAGPAQAGGGGVGAKAVAAIPFGAKPALTLAQICAHSAVGLQTTSEHPLDGHASGRRHTVRVRGANVLACAGSANEGIADYIVRSCTDARAITERGRSLDGLAGTDGRLAVESFGVVGASPFHAGACCAA